MNLGPKSIKTYATPNETVRNRNGAGISTVSRYFYKDTDLISVSRFDQRVRANSLLRYLLGHGIFTGYVSIH